MQNDYVPVREIGSMTANRLMTFARQFAVEYGTASDPNLIAQAPEFADAPVSEMCKKCHVLERGSFLLNGLSDEDAEIGPTLSRWSKMCPGVGCNGEGFA